MADYKFTHDGERCMHCGLCAAFCPCYVLEMRDGVPVAVNPEHLVASYVEDNHIAQKTAVVIVAGHHIGRNP